MNYFKDTGYFKSTNGTDDIAYYVYTPKADIKAVMQISHGMCEYTEMYEEYIEFMTGNGILCCGNDHIGHGSSVKTPDDLGYLGEENGWRFMVRDLRTLTRMMMEENPGLPYFLLGHSMGSFAARAFLSDFDEGLTGCILCGTSGGESLAKFGEAACRQMIKSNGDHFRSDLLGKLSMDLYNEKIPNPDTEYDWTTRDKKKAKEHLYDEKVNYIFTAGGFLNLVQLLEYVTRQDWAGEVMDDIPIYIISGDADPVGNYGKGPKKVFDALISEGKPAEMKLYIGARHELLNEINRNEIYKDILNWMMTKIQ